MRPKRILRKYSLHCRSFTHLWKKAESILHFWDMWQKRRRSFTSNKWIKLIQEISCPVCSYLTYWTQKKFFRILKKAMLKSNLNLGSFVRSNNHWENQTTGVDTETKANGRKRWKLNCTPNGRKSTEFCEAEGLKIIIDVEARTVWKTKVKLRKITKPRM